MNKEKLIRIAYYGALFIVMFIALYHMYGDQKVDTGLKFGYYLSFVVVGVALLAFIINIVRNFRESKGLIIGLVVLAIIGGIAYSMAKPDLLNVVTENLNPTEADKSLSKWTGAGLKTTFILGSLTVLAALYTSLKNVFS